MLSRLVDFSSPQCHSSTSSMTEFRWSHHHTFIILRITRRLGLQWQRQQSGLRCLSLGAGGTAITSRTFLLITFLVWISGHHCEKTEILPTTRLLRHRLGFLLADLLLLKHNNSELTTCVIWLLRRGDICCNNKLGCEKVHSQQSSCKYFSL